MQAEIIEREDFDNAMKELRENPEGINWLLLVYENQKSMKLHFEGSGNGGAEEMKSHLNDDMIGYAMLRYIDQIDDSATVKFVFLHWIGDNAPRMQKAKMSVQRGSVLELFGQFHLNYACPTLDDITDELISKKIGEASGTTSKVLDRKISNEEPVVTSSLQKSTPKIPKSEGVVDSSAKNEKDALQFQEKDAIIEAIKEVRNDELETDWALVGFVSGKNNIVELKGSGRGGLDELKGNLSEDNCYYGILRLINRFEENDTVKFVLIVYMGEKLPKMLRARLVTFSGELKELFSPYHCDVKAEKAEELTMDVIRNAVEFAAGNKVNVIEK